MMDTVHVLAGDSSNREAVFSIRFVSTKFSAGSMVVQ
jgi:hypothetical protein